MFTKWFNQASQIDTLTRNLEFEQRKSAELQGLLEREEFRNKALEKEIIKARNSENRTLRHHADVMSKKAGTASSFARLEVKEETPDQNSKPDERIRWAAEQARLLDIEDGITPLPVEEYETLILRDPDRYLF